MIKLFPGHLYAQVHPENEVLPALRELREKYKEESRLYCIAATRFCAPEFAARVPIENLPPTVFYNTKKMKPPGPKDQTSIDAFMRRYHKILSYEYMKKTAACLSSLCPHDCTHGYMKALGYAEREILNVPINQMSENQIIDHIDCLHRIVLSDSKDASTAYRDVPMRIWNSVLNPPS